MREIALHLLDLAQNAVRAGATRILIRVEEDLAADRLELEVQDNGRGMPAEFVKKITDPFFTTRTTRRVGLGIPLLAAATAHCEGELEVDSQPGVGTKVRATWRHSHIDRAPLGDLAEAVSSLVAAYPEREWRYEHRWNRRSFVFNSREFAAQLGEVPLSHPQVAVFLREYLAEGIKTLKIGAKGEE